MKRGRLFSIFLGLLLCNTNARAQADTLYSENFSTAATLDPQTVYVPGADDRISRGISGTGDGATGIGDLLIFLSQFSQVCGAGAK